MTHEDNIFIFSGHFENAIFELPSNSNKFLIQSTINLPQNIFEFHIINKEIYYIDNAKLIRLSDSKIITTLTEDSAIFGSLLVYIENNRAKLLKLPDLEIINLISHDIGRVFDVTDKYMLSTPTFIDPINNNEPFIAQVCDLNTNQLVAQYDLTNFRPICGLNLLNTGQLLVQRYDDQKLYIFKFNSQEYLTLDLDNYLGLGRSLIICPSKFERSILVACYSKKEEEKQFISLIKY